MITYNTTNNSNKISSVINHPTGYSPQLAEIADLLRDSRDEHMQDIVAENHKQEWVLVSVILDRFFFYLHFLVLIGMVVFVAMFTSKKFNKDETQRMA